MRQTEAVVRLQLFIAHKPSSWLSLTGAFFFILFWPEKTTSSAGETSKTRPRKNFASTCDGNAPNKDHQPRPPSYNANILEITIKTGNFLDLESAFR